MVLSRTFGHKVEEVMERWRKMDNEILRNIFPLHQILLG
jgi:hypothetical protein